MTLVQRRGKLVNKIDIFFLTFEKLFLLRQLTASSGHSRVILDSIDLHFDEFL